MAVDARSGRPRTPAEIEARRAEIAERLAAIDREGAATLDTCAQLPATLVAVDVAIWAVLDRQCAAHAARRDALFAEKTTLEQERATLAPARTRTATGPLQPTDPQGLSTLDLAGQRSQATAGQAFNPSIAVIPDIAYYAEDRKHQAYAPDAVDSLERGFNIREIELAFSGAVDPYFDVWATFAVGSEGLETEEAYVQTRKFLPGLQLRVGRFFSGVGYITKQHPHQWDFVDQALVYDALLGGTLGETGLQVTWLPSLAVYTLLGFEALQGDNPRISQQLADDYPDVFQKAAGPRLFTGFLKVAPDLGYSNAVQGGISAGRSRSHQDATVNVEGLLERAYDGTSWFLGSDWIWRHDSPQPFGRGDVSVQGEYLYRHIDLAEVHRGDLVPSVWSRAVSAQDGAYAQAVYGIAQRWTLAGRVDVLGMTNRLETPTGTIGQESSRRFSSALTFNPTEFSRLRVQYAARSVRQRTRATVHQLFVQFQMSLGAHGAHTF